MSYKEGLNMPSAPAHVFSIHYVSSFVKQTVVGSGFHKSAKSELTSRIRPKTVKENYKQTPCRIFSLKQFFNVCLSLFKDLFPGVKFLNRNKKLLK